MESDDYEYFKKIVIFGSSGSGKTSLTSFFEDKKFQNAEPSNSCR
jgi:GTPase SAR1 family protein